MNDDTVHQANLELLATTRAAYLTTIDQEGWPHSRAMLNLRNRQLYPTQAVFAESHEGRLAVYFTTNSSSRKVAQIKSNPKATVYYCEPSSFHGLMLGGEISIIDDSEIRRSLWDSSWRQFYPTGPDDPDHTVLLLVPTIVRGWNRGTKF